MGADLAISNINLPDARVLTFGIRPCLVEDLCSVTRNRNSAIRYLRAVILRGRHSIFSSLLCLHSVLLLSPACLRVFRSSVPPSPFGCVSFPCCSPWRQLVTSSSLGSCLVARLREVSVLYGPHPVFIYIYILWVIYIYIL